jgi:transposase-like protein
LGRRSTYSAEFQAAAVRLLAEPGATNESVGRDLGLSRETIRKWAKRLAAEADPEVLRVLEEEREILAKAAAFRARETGRTS